MEKVLWSNRILSVVDKNGFFVVHEPFRKDTAVALVPYRQTDKGQEYLLRMETVPAHSKVNELCSITGSFEPGKHNNITETALAELLEESGYTVDATQLIGLGTFKAHKGLATTMYAFSVDLTGAKKGAEITDGSSLEKLGYSKWVDYSNAVSCKDPLVAAIISRLAQLNKGVSVNTIANVIRSLSNRDECVLASMLLDIVPNVVAKKGVNYFIPGDLKTGALLKQLGLQPGELTTKRINQEIKTLQKKYPEGGYSKKDLTLLRRLLLAKKFLGFARAKKRSYRKAV